MQKLTLLAGAALLTINTASFAGADTQAMIDQATAAHNRAKSVGFVWRDHSGKYTDQMIKMAEEALKKGDAATASKYAQRARDLAHLAYRQYTQQQKAGPRF